MDENQDRESELRGDIKAGQRTTVSGCVVALAGILIPLAMFSIPSLFPVGGESQIGWAGIGFAMSLTPVMVIAGIALSIAGLRQTAKAEGELDEDSNRPPERNS